MGKAVRVQMTAPSHPLLLPASVKKAVARLVHEDGASLDQCIAVAIAKKVGAVETAAQLPTRRAGKAAPDDLLPLSGQGQTPAPIPGDGL